MTHFVEDVSEKLLSNMYKDVLNTARKTCPEVKTTYQRNVKQTGVGVLWPTDKKSIECFIKAIDKLLPEADKVKSNLLNKYKAELKRKRQEID